MGNPVRRLEKRLEFVKELQWEQLLGKVWVFQVNKSVTMWVLLKGAQRVKMSVTEWLL